MSDRTTRTQIENLSPVPINPATEDTQLAILAAIAAGSGADPVGIKDTTAAAINPATKENQTNGLQKTQVVNTSGTGVDPASEQTSEILTRLLNVLESLQTTDLKQRLRINIDSVGTGSTEFTSALPVAIGTGSSFLGYVGISTDSTAALGFPVHQRFELQDYAHIAFANAIASNISFT